MKERLPFLSFRVRWWYWVTLGVVWGMLCVWVRLQALEAGRMMSQDLARHNELLARVQADDRALAEVRQLENMEKRATALGFVKLGTGSLVIVPPETGGGFLSRLLGAKEQGSREGAEPAPAGESAKPAKRPRRPAPVRPRAKKRT